MSGVYFTPEQLKRLRDLKAREWVTLSKEEKAEVRALETLYWAVTSTGVERKNAITGMDKATQAIFLGFAILFAIVIIVVALVALFQKTIDPAGVLALMGGIFTGLVPTILVLRNRGDKSNGP